MSERMKCTWINADRIFLKLSNLAIIDVIKRGITFPASSRTKVSIMNSC